MKKNLYFTFMVVFALTGCIKDNACKQPHSQEEIPELNTEGYNTCETIVENFTFLICDGQHGSFPYWSHEGDTIKVCGYIHKEHWQFGGSPLPLYDGNPESQDLDIVGVLPETPDVSKKCYVEGLLYFNPHYTNGSRYTIVPSIVSIKEFVFE